MDEEKKPSTADHALEYWHSSERTPTRLMLGLSFFAGFFTSFVVIALLGTICAFGSMDPKPGGGRRFTWAVASACGGCFIASIVWLFKYRREQRELPLESRRQSHRFFELGILIGFGVATLLEGICFGAMSAVNSP